VTWIADPLWPLLQGHEEVPALGLAAAWGGCASLGTNAMACTAVPGNPWPSGLCCQLSWVSPSPEDMI